MTVTLGWKSAVAAALILAALVGSAIWLVHSNARRNEQDWERKQLVESLRLDLDKARKEMALLRAESDSLRDERDQGKVALEEALAGYQKLVTIENPTPSQVSETCVACKAVVTLLEADLRLAGLESIALRRELDVAYGAIETCERMVDVQTQRVESAWKSVKKSKRRTIWSGVGIGASGVLAGYGFGKIGC